MVLRRWSSATRFSLYCSSSPLSLSKPKPANLTIFPTLQSALPSFRALSTKTISKFSSSHTSDAHNSKTNKPSLASTCIETLAFLVLGSLVYFGRLNNKPALALADNAPKTCSSREEEVVEMYHRILDRNPREVEALKVVAYGKMRKGVHGAGEVVELVERLIEVEPEEVEWRLLQALAYELKGELEKSKLAYRRILGEKPLLVRALHGLALTMCKSGEGAAALLMLHEAVETARSDYRVTEGRNVKLLIADVHVTQGDLNGALKELQDLINEDHRDFRPHLLLGVVYSLLGKTKEADEHYEIYRSLVYDEFPNKSFIDAVMMDAKRESQKKT